jgi:nicotinamide mononucleotide (NMN) deamidase PncC
MYSLIRDLSERAQPFSEDIADGSFCTLTHAADVLFMDLEHRFQTVLTRHTMPADWNAKVEEARAELQRWAEESQRPQNYTPESLARAKIEKGVASDFAKEHAGELALTNALHGSIVNSAIKANLAEKMKIAGKEGNKLALLELSARLSPGMTFPGSSAYFEIAAIPYGVGSRQVLGEAEQKRLVSEESAIESVRNIAERFDVKYALAETSMAPADRIMKSARKPEVYIASYRNREIGVEHHVIDTNFRDKFDATVRELMFHALKKMYE